MAERGPQGSILVLVESKSRSIMHRMAGIGACGYNDPIEEWILEQGIKLGPHDDYMFGFPYEGGVYQGSDHKILTISRATGSTETLKVPWNDDMAKRLKKQWVGILPETVTALMKFLRDVYKGDDDESEGLAWVERIEKAQPLRANQGEMFFDRHLGTGVHATPPGDENAGGP